MARTTFIVTPPPQRQTDTPSEPPTPLASGLGFSVDGIVVHGLAADGNEMIMIPKDYETREDYGEEAPWRTNSDGDASKCWQTTLIYQHIGAHPRLLRFIRPDPWTWLPVIANPGGPPLREFLKTNYNRMYEERTDLNRSTASGRVKSNRKSLVYQWAIHLASAMEFIHGYSFEQPAPRIEIVFGDLAVDSCWLTLPGLSLSVLGFLGSGFRTRSGPLHLGDIRTVEPFQPLYGVRGPACRPTLQTDLFLWGCVVYELVTGYWPGNGQDLSWQEMSALMSRREWPRLDTEYLGDVVHKCWAGEITSAAELLATVRTSVTSLGAVIDDNDEVLDVDVEDFIDLTCQT